MGCPRKVYKPFDCILDDPENVRTVTLADDRGPEPFCAACSWRPVDAQAERERLSGRTAMRLWHTAAVCRE